MPPKEESTNVLFLAAGKSSDQTQAGYPRCLTEIDGKPLLEKQHAATALLAPGNCIFVFDRDENKRFHLDSIARQLDPACAVVTAEASVAGAACSALLAAEWIDNDCPLLIVNVNEIVNADIQTLVHRFESQGADAGVVTFDSLHPRYSYVRLDTENFVVEAAEKHPISRHAVVGIYWFHKGRDFVEAAKQMIRKNAAHNGAFYICPSLNELVLKNKKIAAFPIDAKLYIPLKDDRQVLSYETNRQRQEA